MAFKKAQPKVKASTSTAVTQWDEELARQAEIAMAMEASSSTAQFFSVKGGVLKWDDVAVPNNRMVVIIADYVFENVYYAEEFDTDNPSAPTCFAFGRDEKTIAPHDSVIAKEQQQHDKCAGCPQNEWGTAIRGRGKACRNTRRLAVLAAGNLDKQGNFKPFDEDELLKSPVGFLKLPVTSVKAFSQFVKGLAVVMKRPPFAIYTEISVIPDEDTQFRVTFEPLDAVPSELIGAVMRRVEEAKATIEAPYDLSGDRDEDEKPRGKAKAAPKGKAAAKSKAAPKGKAKTGRKY